MSEIEKQGDLASRESVASQKKVLIVVSTAIGIIVVVIVVWLLVAVLMRQKNEVTPAEVTEITNTVYNEAAEKAGANNAEVADGEKEEDLAAANEVFAQAITKANAANDEALANSLRVSQMGFYFDTNNDYAAIIRIADEVNIAKLDKETLAEYYNYLANAYWEKGDQARANEYYDLIIELSGGEEYGE